MSLYIKVEKSELDEAIFAACTEASEKLHGQTTRQRLTFALAVSEHIMASVAQLQGKQERSARASKAAKARYAEKAEGEQPLQGGILEPRPKRKRRTKAEIRADAAAKATLPLPHVAPPSPVPDNIGPALSRLPTPADDGILPAPFGQAKVHQPDDSRI